MASSRKRAKDDNSSLFNTRGFRNIVRQINNRLGQSNLSLYGTDRTSDVDVLNGQFNRIMNMGIQSISSKEEGDVSSFLSKLVSQERKTAAFDSLFNNQFNSNNDISAMESFLQEAYRNRIAEQTDLHQVASQLIELSEAILVTRDAIISADIVEGRMSRTLSFENIGMDEEKDYIPIVETMETKFKLLEKIKNFIVPKTLEYGEYYAYTIPYSKLFNDFEKQYGSRGENTYGRSYCESGKTLLEFVVESGNQSNNISNNKSSENEFIDRLYKEYEELCKEEYKLNKNVNGDFKEPDKKEFTTDVSHLLKNVSINNSPTPIPILEEGYESIKEIQDQYITENRNGNEENIFENSIKFLKDGEIYYYSKKDNYDGISGCYIKLIEPTRIIPIKIMDSVIGYYYIQTEDVAPVSGMVSSTLHYTKFDRIGKEHTIIDAIASQIVRSFNKKFLQDNVKFKKIIADAIQYYNINEKRVQFQFIPVEYMQVFKIDEDEDGNGQSMIKKSLFYAKLYLMLLLFKIMSIILNSNDTKVNYVKQSGIDKNIANKIQEIIRIKQSRQINVMDLFNYSTLINKVGSGNETYIPVGRSGERGIETEILSGQDVQLNSELLEMLKNSYILGTGVPATIINYLNEVEFAKVAEQNNTKYNARVVNYQLDFNPSITEWYKKIMKFSTTIPEDIIENFIFVLQPPKSVSATAKSELINSFQQNCEFLVSLLFKDPEKDADAVREFKILLANDQLPMLNIKNLLKLVDDAKLKSTENSLSPSSDNGDNGDDMGLDGL